MRDKPPEVIWLQWFGDPNDCDCPDGPEKCVQGGKGEITWCEDKQHESDIRYVIAPFDPREDR